MMIILMIIIINIISSITSIADDGDYCGGGDNDGGCDEYDDLYAANQNK